MENEKKFTGPAYEFEAKMPLKQAIPLGLQHVLAMFVGNLTPLLIITGACGITGVYFWPDLPRCFREVYRVLKPGGTFLICNESNGDTDRDEKWTEIIGGMTIYKDAELKAYLEQAGFHEVQIHKKKSWLCITVRK